MELKLTCVHCRKEMLHDVEIDGDDVTLEIYPCGACRKVAYQEGWKKGVANYLNAEIEEGGEDGQKTT